MKEKSEFLWFSSGFLVFLEWFLAGKTGVLEFVDTFSQFGKGKEKRFTPPKMTFHHYDHQASTLVDPCDFVKIKGWDGHTTDGSPSWGRSRRQDGWTSPSVLQSLRPSSAVLRPLRNTDHRSLSSS